MFLYVEEDTKHIKTSGIGRYTLSNNPKDFNYIYENFELNDIQKSKLNELKAISKVMENVTVTIEAGKTYNLSDPIDLARMKADKESPEAIKKREDQEEIKRRS